MQRVRLRVDDEPWGTFAVDAADPLEGSGGWTTSDSPSQALVLAELGRELERTNDPLDTIGEWRALLDKHLAPGGHVAEVVSLQLHAPDGSSLRVEPRLLLPVDVAQGDEIAYLGEVVVDLDPGAMQ